MSRANHKRTAHRWQVGGMLAAGVVFALGSFWLVQVINGGDIGALSDPLKSEPDYTVEKFSFVRMTPAGKPGYIISGDKLTHRPSDDTFDVIQPVVLNVGSEKPPMTMHAKTAHIDQAQDVVELTGDVDIRRPQQGAAQSMSLKTEALTVFPDEDRMQTAQPFKLVLGTTNLAGVGMKANNATGRLDVQNRVQLDFPPRAR
jgi:lipopolysaccharide export system protein LptC